MDKANTIIAYFSRSGENFKVGNVDKGSAEKIAEIINRLTGIPEYQIVPEKAYPADLSECNKVAREEQQSNARPALRSALPDMNNIENIILVYPNWWSDLPMVVYTFLDGIMKEGLNIYPVCTHEDSGLAMMERKLSQVYKTAVIGKGIAIRGSVVQSDELKAEEAISKYLESIR